MPSRPHSLICLILILAVVAPLRAGEDPIEAKIRQLHTESAFCRVLANLSTLSGETVEFFAVMRKNEHGLTLSLGSGFCPPVQLGGRSWPDSIAADFAPPADNEKAAGHVKEIQALLCSFSEPNPRRELSFPVTVRGRLVIAKKDPAVAAGWRGFGQKNEAPAMLLIEDIAEMR
jgi:hypothetical protein